MKIADLFLIYTVVAVAVILIDRLNDIRKKRKLPIEKQRKSKFYNFSIEEMEG